MDMRSKLSFSPWGGLSCISLGKDVGEAEIVLSIVSSVFLLFIKTVCAVLCFSLAGTDSFD